MVCGRLGGWVGRVGGGRVDGRTTSNPTQPQPKPKPFLNLNLNFHPRLLILQFIFISISWGPLSYILLTSGYNQCVAMEKKHIMQQYYTNTTILHVILFVGR